MNKEPRNEGSAWAFLFKLAGIGILFWLLPLIALNSEAIDRFCDSVEGQKVIFFTTVCFIGGFGIAWFWNWLKKRLSA